MAISMGEYVCVSVQAPPTGHSARGGAQKGVAWHGRQPDCLRPKPAGDTDNVPPAHGAWWGCSARVRYADSPEGDLCRFWRPVRRCGDRRQRRDHPARNGGKGIHRVNAGVGQHFQLVGEITLVIHQRVVTCVRECIGCSRVGMHAELRRLCPLRCRRRHIQTGRTDPDTQEKVEDQDRSKTP